jgi:diguanylate cyclase (GGDEF)-like protein
MEGVLGLLSQSLEVRLSMVTRIEGSTLTIVAAVDQLDLAQGGAVIPLDDTICVNVLKAGETGIADTQTAKQEIRGGAYARELAIRAYAGVPIMLGDGQIYGTLTVAESHPRLWRANELTTLRLMARLLSHELNLEREERLAERSRQFSHGMQLTDELTGLGSAGAFATQLRTEAYRSLRYGGRYSIAIVELQDYAKIEQEHGTIVRDQLVQGLATTLMLNSRIVDCCARLEGGRFAILFPETPACNLPGWQARIEAGLQTWALLHPNLNIELRYSLGVADNEDAGDDQAVLRLATERLTTQHRPAE